MTTRYPTLDEVLGLHEGFMHVQGTAAILAEQGKLEAALARPQATVFGEDAFPTLAEKAAALLQAVVIGHPFFDGNKRAALGSRLFLLEINGSDVLGGDHDAMHTVVLVLRDVRFSVLPLARRTLPAQTIFMRQFVANDTWHG